MGAHDGADSEGNNPDAFRRMGARLAGEAKTTPVNELVKCFGDFVHLAWHDQSTAIDVTRIEAMVNSAVP